MCRSQRAPISIELLRRLGLRSPSFFRFRLPVYPFPRRNISIPIPLSMQFRPPDLPSDQQRPPLQPVDSRRLLIRDAWQFDLNVIRVFCLADIRVGDPGWGFMEAESWHGSGWLGEVADVVDTPADAAADARG